ncbi:AsmA family protein [Hyphomicrobium sp.]|uniref:AsmA family protein n=1 Tax=Hyphomicrobium sp. TaxID=82 RepID=UPI002E2F2156|nr:AsmA family protein [Hyphomicrobium sp.]HEX2840884.1 AsmA family protein [Hyphomicrobium sp.]
MIGKADKRRPFFVAIALIAAIGAALVAPVLIGARRGEPIPGSTVRADSRDSVTISAPLPLFASPAITLERGTVALVNPTGGESRVGALLRTLMTGGGADLVLDGATLVVDRTAPSFTSPSAPSGTPSELGPIVSALSGFKFNTLTLLNVDIVVKSTYGETEMTVTSAEVTSERGGMVNAKGRLEFLDEPFDFDVRFSLPNGNADSPLKVRAAVKGDFLSTSFNGRLSAGERAQITADNAELSISDVRKLVGWLGASWPAGPGLGPFTAKGTLTLEDRSLTFEHAKFTLDGNAATGALTAKLGLKRPCIEGTLAFASFDVTPYAAQSRPYALALASDWLASLRAPGLASSSFLRDMDADIRLSANNVMSGADRLGRGAASLSIRDGKIYGEIAELELEQGGTGEGQFTVDVNGAAPHYAIRAELNDIDLATVVAPRLGPAGLDGNGDIRMDLNATGASEPDIRKSLAGTISLEMSEGARVGISLDALPGAATMPVAAAGWAAATAGSTTVSRLTAQFSAASGILTAESVVAQTETHSVTAAGTVDIDKNAVDLVLSISGALGEVAPQSDVGAFKIHGPLSSPTVTRSEPGKAALSTTDPNPG